MSNSNRSTQLFFGVSQRRDMRASSTTRSNVNANNGLYSSVVNAHGQTYNQRSSLTPAISHTNIKKQSKSPAH